jgi:hypothetical protein
MKKKLTDKPTGTLSQKVVTKHNSDDNGSKDVRSVSSLPTEDLMFP